MAYQRTDHTVADGNVAQRPKQTVQQRVSWLSYEPDVAQEDIPATQNQETEHTVREKAEKYGSWLVAAGIDEDEAITW